MFPGIVPKMNKSLTLLATLQAKLGTHENSGCHFNSGAAHHGWGCLYGPAFHQRSGDCSTGELSGPFQVALSWGTIAMLNVDQFLRLICVPAVVFAFVVASQISVVLNPPPAMTMAGD